MTKPEEKKSFPGFRQYIREHEPVIRDLLDSLALLILSLYPFRNIHEGLDLWDTGYNLSNFRFMSLDHMDPMWFFSTYLANSVGHLFTLLPYGHTLLGMNFYTAFVPAVMAVFMYIFLTRQLKMPGWIAFLGEFTALSMCWAPTAVLYHYLTYMIITFSALLLYRGIIEDEALTVAISGGLCGLGIFVRFSNLPQASLLLAIWMYGVFEFREEYRAGDGVRLPSRIEAFRKTFMRGFWFCLGYATAFIVFFLFIGIRYGFAAYLGGVAELFTIPDNASGYGPAALIMGVVRMYKDQIYWILRLLVFAAAAGVIRFLATFVNDRYSLGKEDEKGRGTSQRIIDVLANASGIIIAVCAVMFLVIRDTILYDYNNYLSWRLLAAKVAFVMLCYCVYSVFARKASASEKLMAVLAGYVLLITGIGGNNVDMAVFNNAFFWMPVLLFAVYELIRNCRISALYGLKCVLTAVVLFFLVQVVLFGANFVFCEASSGSGDERAYTVSDDSALRDIRMSYEKASCLTQLTAYIEGRELADRELITFGNIPALPFYLQMTPAFNTWPDLDSYSIEKMSRELERIAARTEDSLEENEVGEYYEKPVVIICISDNSSVSDDEAKWKLIYGFLEKEDYKLTYTDTLFAVYE